MTAPALHIVKPDIEAEIAATAKEVKAAAKKDALAIIGRGKSPAEILPPDGGNWRLDDVSNARRFLELTGEDIIYVAEKKKWLIWDRNRWTDDRTDMIADLAIYFADSLYLPENARDEAALKHAKRSNNRSGLNAFIEIAQRLKTVSIDALDTNPYLLNCRNGTLDLRTGELRPHDRGDFITRVVNADFDSDAIGETWRKFIDTVQPDPDIQAFLQRSVGYSFLGEARERTFWILHGTGNNGKSIFIDSFNNLLGDYASSTSTGTVMQRSPNKIPNDIARLKGKRFITIPETEENEKINAALIKAFAAGDKVTARFLYAEEFDFYFSGKLWIATNHKPRITDHSKGFWQRLKLIPFTQDIPKEQVIKRDELLAKLADEGSAMLAWAYWGCRDYFDADDLGVPPVIQTEIDAYRYDQDSIAQFIDEYCRTLDQARESQKQNGAEPYLIAGDYTVKNADLYAAYKKFCEQNGVFLFSHTRLSQNMKDRGFIQRTSGDRFWEGIRLIGN